MHDLLPETEPMLPSNVREEKPGGPRSWIPRIFVVVIFLALPVLTYVVVVNDMAAALTGTIYTEDEYQTGLDQSRQDGFTAGETQGYDEGEQVGFASGHKAGEQAGHESGYKAGELAGRKAGYEAGRTDGYSSGVDVGYQSGFQNGNEEGLSEGYQEGYDEGFVDGCEALFEGLETDRVGNWWDYYWSPAYASYYEKPSCFTMSLWTFNFDLGS